MGPKLAFLQSRLGLDAKSWWRLPRCSTTAWRRTWGPSWPSCNRDWASMPSRGGVSLGAPLQRGGELGAQAGLPAIATGPRCQAVAQGRGDVSSVVGYSVEENLEPKLSFLQSRLGLDAKQLRKVVVASPPLLGYSVEENLGPKLAFLQSRL